jgi:hypothetical protein
MLNKIDIRYLASGSRLSMKDETPICSKPEDMRDEEEPSAFDEDEAPVSLPNKYGTVTEFYFMLA